MGEEGTAAACRRNPQVSQPCSIFCSGAARRAPAGARVHPHPQPPHFTHRIAIELGQLWSLRADDDGAALPVLHYPVTTAAAGQHPRGHRQPAEDAPRPDGHDIQQPVIHPGGGHQHQPGKKLAAVADHHRADLTGRLNPAIRSEGDRGPRRAHSVASSSVELLQAEWDGAGPVGGPCDLLPGGVVE
jgi:hypothetical protein